MPDTRRVLGRVRDLGGHVDPRERFHALNAAGEIRTFRHRTSAHRWLVHGNPARAPLPPGARLILPEAVQRLAYWQVRASAKAAARAALLAEGPDG